MAKAAALASAAAPAESAIRWPPGDSVITLPAALVQLTSVSWWACPRGVRSRGGVPCTRPPGPYDARGLGVLRARAHAQEGDANALGDLAGGVATAVIGEAQALLLQAEDPAAAVPAVTAAWAADRGVAGELGTALCMDVEAWADPGAASVESPGSRDDGLERSCVAGGVMAEASGVCCLWPHCTSGNGSCSRPCTGGTRSGEILQS